MVRLVAWRRGTDSWAARACHRASQTRIEEVLLHHLLCPLRLRCQLRLRCVREDECSMETPILESRVRYSTVFNSKFKDGVPKSDGKREREGWRKRVVNYQISRCPDIKDAIGWAESRGRSCEIIGVRDVVGRKTTGGADFAMLDFSLWGFLNTHLGGAAWNLWESIEG